MKKLPALAIAFVLAQSPFVYASGDHDANAMKMSSMSMNMSADMKSKMKAMKADMMAIQKESDPEKRKVLMQQHMKSMNSMMGTMKGERSNMHDKHMDQMKQFETRLAMMEVMMEQLVVNQTVLSNPDSTFKWDETADEYQLQ